MKTIITALLIAATSFAGIAQTVNHVKATKTVIPAVYNHCRGTKKDGTTCKSPIVNKDGYCRYHDPKAIRCQFIKKNGERCKMVVKPGERYCRFHKAN